jgi:hypothetical protein
MRAPLVPPAVLVTMLLSYPAARAHDDRGRSHHPQRVSAPEAAPAGWGKLRNRAQHMCLDAAGWAAASGADALLWSCNNDPDQVWFFAPNGEIKNAHNGLCLTITNRDRRDRDRDDRDRDRDRDDDDRDRGRGRDRDRAYGRPREIARGADVGIDRCDGSPHQRWAVVARAHGAFEVRPGRRDLCLDVEGRRGAHGDDVKVWSCDQGADQTWGWEPVAQPPPPRVVFRQPHQPPRAHHPGPPSVQPMDPPSFRTFLGAVRQANYAANQLSVIEQAAAHHHFLVVQLRAIVGALSFSATQVRAVEIIAPRLLDPENGYQLFDAFPFSADQEKVRRILARHRRSQPPAAAQTVPPR